ncbi:MAG: nitroreductase family protein [Bdellovibrionota bacterium]
MSNPIHSQVIERRSIRKYKPDPVPEEVLKRILEAATRSSSSGNMQAYSVIVTSDPSIRAEMLKAHFDQRMVVEAPLFLTFCADFHRMREWLVLREAPMNFDNFMSFMIAAIDSILAAQTASLAAEAEGLGICFLGTTLASCGDLAKILQCPSHVVPVVGFCMGYADESPAPRDRLPLESLVHRERYEQKAVEEAYRIREVTGWKRYLESPELRKKIEDSGVENLAQVYTKLKYTRESHVEYSRAVTTCLEERGFLGTEAPMF